MIPSLTWGSFQQYFCPRTNWWWAVGIFSSDIEFIVCVHLKSDKFVWDYFPWDISVPPRSFICGSQCKFIAKDHIGFRLCWWCAPPHSYGTSTIGWFPFQNFWRWWRGEIHWKINFSKEVAWLIVLNNGRWMNRWTDERIKKSMNGLMNGWWRDLWKKKERKDEQRIHFSYVYFFLQENLSRHYLSWSLDSVSEAFESCTRYGGKWKFGILIKNWNFELNMDFRNEPLKHREEF